MDRTRPSCAAKGDHPGWRSFFGGTAREGLVHQSLKCDATSEYWERRVDEYERGENPLVLCKDAAVEKGLRW